MRVYNSCKYIIDIDKKVGKNMKYRVGMDIGSTTLKTVVLDENNNICYKSYERHFSRVREGALEKIKELKDLLIDKEISLAITGSAGMGIANIGRFDFVQEVYAVSKFVKKKYPLIDVVIELGGEDAKIIFLGDVIEERMNSTCAGGTGAFIDQMAMLLNVSTEELDKLSEKADAVYPIASRCGVFAKTDIQPLINQGARGENIAASIYGAVVDQTITGLAQGREIKGNVLFLGGPLKFLKGLQKTFKETLNLKEKEAIFPEDGEYFVALGAALYSSTQKNLYSYGEILGRVLQCQKAKKEIIGIEPLFSSEEEYEEFKERHEKASVKRVVSKDYNGNAYLGIDAGSTTTKIALIDEENRLIYEYYTQNKGNPLEVVKDQLEHIYTNYPNIKIVHSGVTGYGEELIRNAFSIDVGTVETVAHYIAAGYFNPNVDFIIDIGGQDMKCFSIKDGAIDNIMLNEACSSGCGSFIETFATTLGYSIGEFARLAIKAKRPVDLGTRCTVFMNSSIKQAQKNGATVEDISAGLSISVVKNAIYKVLRVSEGKSLGENIVVQGGTFLNESVLRAFEKLIGQEVKRPDISGLMGAFGIALFSKMKGSGESKIIKLEELKRFTHKSTSTKCGLCQNKCNITINEFSSGKRYISGNRCENPIRKERIKGLPNLYEFKREYLSKYNYHKGEKCVVGLPKVLNYYDTMPFWFAFFKELGFTVKTSGDSTRELYRKGQHTIPSDTVCYGGKLVHGHIMDLIEKKVDVIFYPCMSYNFNEGISDNCYHCPVVAYYPEIIKSNIEMSEGIRFLYPYISLNDMKFFKKRMVKELKLIDSSISLKDIEAASNKAMKELKEYRQAVYEKGKKSFNYAKENNIKTIILAGRPYHIDSEINHGIDKLISSLGFVVLSEDSILPFMKKDQRNVLNQWSYHGRMYGAAEFVCGEKNTELVQLISFGCGLDAVTSDEVKSILRDKGKLYTQLKIDEITNLGAVKIRIRSLMAAMEERSKNEE